MPPKRDSLLHGPHRRPGRGRDLLEPPGAPPQAAWNTYIRVESADDADSPGARGGRASDLGAVRRVRRGADGRVRRSRGRGLLRVATWIAPRLGGGQRAWRGELQQPAHDDVEAARAFYGAVFGWTTIDAGSPMWALPGYGDHLEELNPGLRAGMKQMGAPEGFEDVVATILPREGTPARWSVTFAVDDVDAITARARELGGSVLAEPQNAPWVRFAVLADPAGASFTASQFVAENR